MSQIGATISNFSVILGDGTPQCQGRVSIDLSTKISPYALSVAEYQNQKVDLTGALTANFIIQIPTANGASVRINNKTTGAFTLTVSPPSGGTSVTVTQGKRCWIEADGTNWERQTAEV